MCESVFRRDKKKSATDARQCASEERCDKEDDESRNEKTDSRCKSPVRVMKKKIRVTELYHRLIGTFASARHDAERLPFARSPPFSFIDNAASNEGHIAPWSMLILGYNPGSMHGVGIDIAILSIER